MKKDYPIWNTVEIDINSLCNRDCFFCPRYNNRNGIRKDKNGNKIDKKMPTEKVYSILDELSEIGYSGRITFHRLSEALIDSRYLDFVKYAKKKGMEIVDHTNGDVLSKNDTLCKQLDGLVDTFVVGLYDYKTVSERDELVEFWKKRFQKTKIEFSTPTEGPVIRQGSSMYEDAKKDDRILDLPCTRRLTALLIRYDGEVSLCCEDDNCNFNLGNVFEQSIEKMWWSKKHIDIVKDLQKPGSRHHYKLCKKCYKGYGKENRLTFKQNIKNQLKLKWNNLTK